MVNQAKKNTVLAKQSEYSDAELSARKDTKKYSSSTQNKISNKLAINNIFKLNTSVYICIISATRLSAVDFWEKSALGISLLRISEQHQHHQFVHLDFNIAFNNNLGLSEVFNAQIASAAAHTVLVFIHDDVWIDDTDFIANIMAGLSEFDIIGIVGNVRHLPHQPAWCYINHHFVWDGQTNLSGEIAHGKSAFGTNTKFGKAPRACALLDGVFIASTQHCLIKNKVLFDPQFDFHFYDLDFCRTATKAGLKLGTWPISLTHQGIGDFGCQTWRERYQQYLNKWEPMVADADLADYLQETKQYHQDLQLAINNVLHLAATHDKAGELTHAMQLYEEVIAIAPNHARANYQLGLLEVNSRDLDVGLPHLERAIQNAPDCEQFWVTYIETLVQFGAINEAIAALKLGKQHGITLATADKIVTSQFVTDNAKLAAPEHSPHQITLKKLLIDLVHGIPLLHKTQCQAFLNVSEFEARVNQLLVDGFEDDVLTLIHQTIKFIKVHPDLVGHTVFTPYFDHVLANINLGISPIVPTLNKSNNLVIASELYEVGGHSKVVIDLLSHLDNPVLVLTDIYNRNIQIEAVRQLLGTAIDCPIHVLSNTSLINKSEALAKIINTQARHVFLLSHHDDSVAITACQKTLDARFYFVHHADHNPALGNTVAHLEHVDLFECRAAQCADVLSRPTLTLPIATADFGKKSFAYPIKTFATVTAGSFGKFDNASSLSNLVIACMQVTGGQHHHFGDIPHTQLKSIAEALTAAHIQTSDFIYHGNVPSLWQALLNIDAHIYLGSAPIGGGRGDIEAQGVGYPLLSYKDQLGPKFINIGNHHADTIYWSNLVQMQAGLKYIMQNHLPLSASSRIFYQKNCSSESFKKTLTSLCNRH
ncbi:MAG: hypothetical protein H7Z18_07475 [Methylophilaceae bacterium]|nr:hypothetical protein [Methylophilaceae bacterium]